MADSSPTEDIRLLVTAEAMEFRTFEVARATPSIMRPSPYRLAKNTVTVRHREKMIKRMASVEVASFKELELPAHNGRLSFRVLL